MTPSEARTQPPPSAPSPLKPLFPAGLVGEFETHEFNEMQSVPPLWQQEYRQLGRGQFFGNLKMAHTARMQMATVAWTPGVLSCGLGPPGATMLGVPQNVHGKAYQRGAPITNEQVSVLPSGEEIDFRTVGAMSAFVVTVDHEVLERHTQALLGCPFAAIQKGDRLAIQDVPAMWRRIDTLIELLRTDILRNPADLRDPALAEELEAKVIAAILRGVRAPATQVQEARRRTIARDAEAYLRAHVDQHVTVTALCEAVGANERTLHMAFQECIGTSPKAYLKMLRLNAARDALRRPEAGTTVSGAAMRWNFSHFGWFSHDYRVMFGESPSQTLARSAGDRKLIQ